MAAVKNEENGDKVAESPFNSDSADAILLSADGVGFRVHRAILALASPFFSTMFALKPSSEEGSKFGGQEEPIPVTEDSVVLDNLLRFCYPARQPVISDLDLLARVLEAGIKYDIDCAMHALRQSLLGRSVSSPLEVYAIGCRLDHEDIASSAAQSLLTQHQQWFSNVWKPNEVAASFEDTPAGHIYYPVLKMVRAGAYFRLLRFLRSKRANPTGLAFSFMQGRLLANTVPTTTKFCQPQATVSRKQSIQVWDLKGADTDIVLKSTDGVHFPVHRLILNIAGAQALISAEAVPDGLPNSVNVDLDSTTLHDLLQACYPPGVITDFRGFFSKARTTLIPFHVLHAAQRFNITPALDFAKSQWDSYLSECPLTAYLGAVALGWTTEVQKAAKATVDRDIADTYSQEMENVSAEIYQQLLNYHYRCRSAASEAARTSLGISEANWKSLCATLTTDYPLASADSILLATHKSPEYAGSGHNVKSLNSVTKLAIQKAISAVALNETQ